MIDDPIPTTYFHGNEAVYTGVSEMIHGEICYEAVLIEGHRKGETIWTYRAPDEDGTAP